MANEMTKTYSELLVETLQKKKQILENLMGLTKAQSRLLTTESFDEEAFDELITEKEQFILELEECDEGFDRVYQRVEEDFKKDKYAYEEQIKKMQALISECMQIGSQIQVDENRNKDLFQQRYAEQKQQIQTYKKSSMAAANYYQHMANQHQTGNSYFVDKKK